MRFWKRYVDDRSVENNIAAFEMKGYREISRIPWKDERIYFLKELEINQRLLKSIKKRMLGFFGREVRANSSQRENDSTVKG